MLNFDRLKFLWEETTEALAGPAGLGRIGHCLRQASAPPMPTLQASVLSAAGRRPPVAWLAGGTPSAAPLNLPPLQFSSKGGAPIKLAELQPLAERHPAVFHEALAASLRTLRANGLEQIWLPEDTSLAARLLALACRGAGISTVLCPGERPTHRPHATDAVIAGPIIDAPPLTAVEPRSPESWLAHLLADDPIEREPEGRVATHTPARTTLQVPRIMGFASWLFRPSIREAADVDLFYKWGVRRTLDRARLDRVSAAYGRPTFVVEDGLFLRSLGLGIGDDRHDALSLSVDTRTAYYDATRPSRLEDRLNSPSELSEAQRDRAVGCMKALREHRLSKYNHAPDSRKRFGSSSRPKVLLLDQRHLDSSVRYGLASATNFDAMFDYVARERPDHDILLKRHPDATLGGTQSYFHRRRIARLAGCGARVYVLDEQVNPHTLLDQIEEAFVVTSGFGFEALMAGCKVHCFGAPFYAGWGLTRDHVSVPRRTRTRSVVELFHYAAIEAATYWSPELDKRVSIEVAIERMAKLRDEHGLT